MTACERVLSIAAGEVGVTEFPAGSNKVKYNTWFYGREVSGASYPWCCSFVVNIFDMAGCATLVRRTSGCTTMMNWFKAKGRLVDIKSAKPGDLVFYQFDADGYADHIGIVVSVTKTGIVAIEGNTSLTSNDNGGAVMRRNRKWSCIMAVARPDYESIDKANTKEECNMTNEEVRKLVQDDVEAAVAKAIKPLDDALTEFIKSFSPKTYNTVEALPEWAKPVVNRLKTAGIIKGDGKNEINLMDGPATLGDVSVADKLLLAMVGAEGQEGE